MAEDNLSSDNVTLSVSDTQDNLSNDNTTSSVSALQAPAHVFWLIGSVFAIICNIFLIMVILKTKAFHKKSQFVIVTLAVAEILQAIAYSVVSIKRLIIYALPLAEKTNQLQCIIENFPIMVFSSAVCIMMLALATDRFVAVCCPIFYKNLPCGLYILGVNFVCWTVAISQGFLSLIDFDSSLKLNACTWESAYNEVYIYIMDTFCHFKAALVVGLEVLTVCLLLMRYKRIKTLPHNKFKDEKGNLEMTTFRAIVLITISFSCSMATNYIVYRAVLAFANDWVDTLLPYADLLLILNSASHLFIYLIMSRKFRKSFISLFRKKPNQQKECSNLKL